MDTMPVDIAFYKAHVPYEHLQYSVTNNAKSADAAIKKHFLETILETLGAIRAKNLL